MATSLTNNGNTESPGADASNQTSDQKNKPLKASDVREARQTRLLKTFLVLSVIYTLYLAKTLFIPLVFSALAALLLSPLVSVARKFYIPRSISAVVLIALLVAPFSFLGVELAEPAERWMHTLPKISDQITDKIDEFTDRFEKARASANQVNEVKREERSSFFSWFGDDEPDPAVEDPPKNEEGVVTGKIRQGSIEILLSTLAGAPLLIAQMFGSVILILFLLVYGPELFSVFIKDFPIVSNKNKTLYLVHQIQTRLSNYILTISVINAILGFSTAIAFMFIGVEDPLLWGALVGLLNFVPYLGGLLSFSILLVAGAVQYGLVALAFLPACVFIFINIIESQFVTPAVLGKKMRVNPLIIILWLSVMGWLWGIVGVLLAVPLLVCIKIILEQIGVLSHWVKLIESG